MNKYRIKGYYMHETERAAAQVAVDAAVISEAEMTPGFVTGIVDEAHFEQLRSSGLILSVIEEVLPAQESNVLAATTQALRPLRPIDLSNIEGGSAQPDPDAITMPVSVAEKSPDAKVLTKVSNRSQIYVVRFHGPLTAARRMQLKEIKIKLLERLSRNKFTAQLKPSEVKKLSELDCVDYIREYSTADTLRPTDTGTTQQPSSVSAPRASNSVKRRRIYNVRLHRKQDMAAIKRWLKTKNVKPLWSREIQLQVSLPEDGSLYRELGSRPEVAIVEAEQPSHFFGDHARRILGIERQNAGIGLEGKGEIVGIADTGLDRSHPDFENRILGVTAWGRPNDSSDPDGHGTHVAGCALGDGTASGGTIRGAAPKARLFFQSILDDQGGLGGLREGIGKILQEAYDAGVRIHNDSWGAFNYAQYGQTSYEVDKFICEHPDMLVIIAGGNDGLGVPRVKGGSMSANKGFVDWSSVADPAASKNALTVGAGRSSRTSGGYSKYKWSEVWPERYPDLPIGGEKVSSDENCLAAFSSRGPAAADRIKPDIVAPGTDIAAAKSADAPLFNFWGAFPNNDKYAFMGGTSMAAPYVAGCAALVREHYRKNEDWQTPSAALLKATLINGAKRMAGGDAVAPLEGNPNFHQGFGLVDMTNTVPNPINPHFRLAHVDTWKTPAQAFRSLGERFRFTIQVAAGMPLRFCLAWTDVQANAIQNVLTLLVDDGSGKKWIGNEKASATHRPSGLLRDPNNNVQVVRIDAPTPGTYTVVVTADTIFVPPQSFALVASGKLLGKLQQQP